MNCLEDPDLWVSESSEERHWAAKGCEGCPVFDWCAREAIRLDPSWGVYAGIDYSRAKTKAKTPATAVCENPECGKTVHSNGTRRRFCNPECQKRGQYLRRLARLAA